MRFGEKNTKITPPQKFNNILNFSTAVCCFVALVAVALIERPTPPDVESFPVTTAPSSDGKPADNHVAADTVDARIVAVKTMAPGQLLPLLRDPCDNIRQAALEALNKTDPETCVRECVALLQSSDPDIQRSAADALGELKPTSAMKGIVPLLRNENPWTRAFAAVALGRMGFKEQTKDLLPLLKDPDPRVRSAAINALGEMGAREYVENIRPLLADRAPEVSEIAQTVLDRFGKN